MALITYICITDVLLPQFFQAHVRILPQLGMETLCSLRNDHGLCHSNMNDVGGFHCSWQSEAHDLWAQNPMCFYTDVLPHLGMEIIPVLSLSQ